MSLRILITAGPTREYLDPIRYLSNGSSGRMGYALAAAASDRGHHVDLVTGPVALQVPQGVKAHRVVSAEDMLLACTPLFLQCDVVIAVAAVADYRPATWHPEKLKKTGQGLTISLVPNVDVLQTLAASRRPNQVIVGFAAETRDVEAYARRKLVEKNCDWIVANDVGQPHIGIDAPDNAIVLIGRNGVCASFGPAPKAEVATFILDHVLPPA